MRYSIKIETGTYTGNGAAQEIAACDGPTWALTKRINGTATACYGMWARMPRNACNSMGISQAERTNQLIELTKDGIYVGSGQSQNAALYAYVAIKALRGSKHFQTGRYYGSAADNRDLLALEGTDSWQPDIVGLHIAVDGNNGRWRSKYNSGDSSQTWLASAGNNSIQAFQPTGFQVGTSQNAAASYYNWWAMREIPGGMKLGSFTGNGSSQSVSVGFQPTFVLVQNITTTNAAYFLTQGMVDNSIASHPVSAASADATAISALTATGFTVGGLDAANKSGDTILWWALRDGEFAPEIARTML